MTEFEIHRAAEAGDTDRVLRLLESGANPNIADARGYSALDHALMERRMMAAKILRAWGAIESPKTLPAAGRPASPDIPFSVRITRIDTRSSRELRLGDAACDMSGWARDVRGWALGPPRSGAAIELDEPLDGLTLGIFGAGHHRILWGTADIRMPDVFRYRPLGVIQSIGLAILGRPSPRLVSERRWRKLSDEFLGRHAAEGQIRLRFWPIRIGSHIIEVS